MQHETKVVRQIEKLIHTPPRSWRILGQAIVDISRNCLFGIDRGGRIFLTNHAATEKFGPTLDSTLAALIPALQKPLGQSIADGRRRVVPSLEIDTSEYRVTVNPIRVAEELIGAICLLEESTELESVARQMRFFQQLTRELEAIINSSSDGLFVCDAQANVIRVNPASERIHKISADKLIGRNMVDLIKEGFIDQSAALQAIKNRQTTSLLQEKDNRKLISIGTPVFDDGGELISVVVSERDITEIDTLHRQLEEQDSLRDQLQNQLLELQLEELKAKQIIARSPSMMKVLEKALKVSGVQSTVLITGESGVGKGLIAKLIHNNSNRAGKPLIRINCGAIPESLIESELFGHEEGAFTGARVGGKPGSLEIANGGTLFLDEIGELPLSAQVKLLRFLENGRLTRVGGTRVRTIDARILVATHRNLEKMVKEGSFRQDLYYRLSVIPLHVPPLRERRDCVFPLVTHYVDYFAMQTNSRKRVSRAALDVLLSYGYPGNVRELMNICEHAVVMSETEVIDRIDLPRSIRQTTVDPALQQAAWPEGMSLGQILESVEKKVLLEAVKRYRSQAAAAAALGISQPTVARRLKKYTAKRSSQTPSTHPLFNIE